MYPTRYKEQKGTAAERTVSVQCLTAIPNTGCSPIYLRPPGKGVTQPFSRAVVESSKIGYGPVYPTRYKEQKGTAAERNVFSKVQCLTAIPNTGCSPIYLRPPGKGVTQPFSRAVVDIAVVV